MKYLLLISSIVITNFYSINAQTIDNSFEGPIPYRAAKVTCTKSLDNGKILAGGIITFYNNTKVNNLIRLNQDGSIDETFNYNDPLSRTVKKIDTQKTGNIIVLTNNPSACILQINSNGEIVKSIDTLYNINSFTILDDDKVVFYGGSGNKGQLYRFNPDLSTDNDFNKMFSFDSYITDVVMFDNKLYVSGYFSHVNDIEQNDIVRLNLDGTLDNSFNTGSGTNDLVGSITLQSDGKIIIGKSFINSFNGYQNLHGLCRLNSDGSFDTNFNPPALSGGFSEIFSFNNALYLAAPTYINDIFNDYFFRLNTNGSIDYTFNPVPLDEFGSIEMNVSYVGDGLIINNSSTTSGCKYGLAKFDLSGIWMNTFMPPISRYGTIEVGDFFNKKLTIAGDFYRVNDVETFGIAQINLDGSVNESFIMPNNMGIGKQIEVINDSSILVSTWKKFYKLNSQGIIDPGFNFKPFKTLYQVVKFRVLPDGKIIAGDPNNVFRLNSDGTEDTSFDIGTGICCSVSSSFDFDIQENKAIYGSYFTQFNGTNVNRVVRLKPDASIDESFAIGNGANDLVSLVKVLNNDDILLGGFFDNFNGVQIPRNLVKISKDGAVDLEFINNQAKSIPFGVQIIDSKVEQIGDLILIKGKNFVTTMNINGTVYKDFEIPITDGTVTDIVPITDSISKGSISFSHKSSSNQFFSLGTFRNSNSESPSFVLKLNIGTSTSSNNDELGSNSEPLKFTIFPNPAFQSLNILPKEQINNFNLTIYNLVGQKVYSKKIDYAAKDLMFDIDIRNLLPGLYFINLSGDSGKSCSLKFIKN